MTNAELARLLELQQEVKMLTWQLQGFRRERETWVRRDREWELLVAAMREVGGMTLEQIFRYDKLRKERP